MILARRWLAEARTEGRRVLKSASTSEDTRCGLRLFITEERSSAGAHRATQARAEASRAWLRLLLVEFLLLVTRLLSGFGLLLVLRLLRCVLVAGGQTAAEAGRAADRIDLWLLMLLALSFSFNDGLAESTNACVRAEATLRL